MTKKLLLTEVTLLVVAVLLFAQTSYAYFSSQKQAGATITSGSVSVMLSEAAVTRDENGDLVEDRTQPRIFGTAEGTVHDYGMVSPGQRIFKDPTISNTGSNEAWIAAKISISDGAGDIHRVMGMENYDDIDISDFMTGGLLAEEAHFGVWNGLEDVTHNSHFAMLQIPHRAEDRYDFYVFILAPVAKAESVVLFENLYFLLEYSNTDIQEFADLRIDVMAYAVQRYGFGSCYDAMLEALPEHFSDLVQSAP